MPHIGKIGEIDTAKAVALGQNVFRTLQGASGDVAQAALLSVLFVIWESNGVTKEQAKAVLLAWIDSHLTERTN